eukprot:7675884-Prorocentrum_lima.AAC.1
MTSSLVGSEMCIRDRGFRHRTGSATRHVIRHVDFQCQVWPRLMMRDEPVSYTHLTLPTICSV